MKIKNKLYGILAGTACLLSVTSCNVDPEFFTQTAPETFYTSQDAVWQRFNRPFTHWRWFAGHNSARWAMQELGTDEYCLPTRGSDWFDGAKYQKWHHHEYSSSLSSHFNDANKNVGMGVALAWDALEDIAEIDFDKLGFPAGTRESMLAQQQILAASLLLDGLDIFGGQPLYRSTREELKPRSSSLETFEFIDSLITEALPKLPVKSELGATETSAPFAAVGAALRARLYFNAEVYIGKAMYNEAATICQDFIDGKYGKYALEEDWTQAFGFNNGTSTEIIWSVVSENAKTESGGDLSTWLMHYNYANYLGGLEGLGHNNGICLAPSLDPQGRPYSGAPYNYKLGSPFEKYHEKDVRKQNYVYLGNGQFRGMFVMGELVNPLNPDWKCTGGREYAGQVITIIDQIARFSEVGPGKKYASIDELPSDISTAEENSGIRVARHWVLPDVNDAKLRGNADIPVIRLAEIYYTLAECKYRLGDADGAAQLINTVRARYFEDADPDPVTAANLDKYRFLDEWMIEFLGEGRRRTDLVRWDAYVTEDWWDHKATNNPNFNLMPIHYSIMGANNLLEQNPGY